MSWKNTKMIRPSASWFAFQQSKSSLLNTPPNWFSDTRTIKCWNNYVSQSTRGKGPHSAIRLHNTAFVYNVLLETGWCCLKSVGRDIFFFSSYFYLLIMQGSIDWRKLCWIRLIHSSRKILQFFSVNSDKHLLGILIQTQSQQQQQQKIDFESEKMFSNYFLTSHSKWFQQGQNVLSFVISKIKRGEKKWKEK